MKRAKEKQLIKHKESSIRLTDDLSSDTMDIRIWHIQNTEEFHQPNIPYPTILKKIKKKLRHSQIIKTERIFARKLTTENIRESPLQWNKRTLDKYLNPHKEKKDTDKSIS